MIVHVTVKPDPVFERDGFDVWVHEPITFSQAVLGAEITVPTVDGKVAYTLPEGTQSGTRFRLRGKGIQYLNGRGRGDQYVVVDVEIPKKLTKAQRDALKAFEDTLRGRQLRKAQGLLQEPEGPLPVMLSGSSLPPAGRTCREDQPASRVDFHHKGSGLILFCCRITPTGPAGRCPPGSWPPAPPSGRACPPGR